MRQLPWWGSRPGDPQRSGPAFFPEARVPWEAVFVEEEFEVGADDVVEDHGPREARPARMVSHFEE